MKRTQTIFAAILALALLFALAVPASAAYDYEANAKIMVSDYSGKTVILHSNDVHGALAGYARMAGLKAQLEANGADVYLADAGDFSQGTVYVSTTRGASAVTLMNEAGYDLATLGNHEFDYGDARLIKNLEQANFKVICADVYRAQTGEPLYDPSVLIETKNGLKLGFFGLETPETATKVNPGMTKDVSFAAFDDFYASAQLAVDGLKAQGADLIFGLVHLGVDDESAENGYRSIDLYDKVSDIDFLIDGHSHTIMTAGENGEPIQSTGTGFQYIGVIIIDNETKKIEDHFLMETAGLQQDTLVSAAAQAIISTVDAGLGKVFAESKVFLNGEREPGNRTEETNMGNLITEAMVWCAGRDGILEMLYPGLPVVGITNGGGIRASVNAGEVTMKDINTVLPFGSTVAVVCVTGRELLEVLEASTYCTPQAVGGFPQTCGIEWTLDTTVDYDQGDVYLLGDKESSYYAPASIRRVTIQTVNGKPFDEDNLYVVVTNDFCAAGGDTYNVFNRAYSQGLGFDTGILMDLAVVDYITEVLGGVIGEDYAEPSAEVRIILP